MTVAAATRAVSGLERVGDAKQESGSVHLLGNGWNTPPGRPNSVITRDNTCYHVFVNYSAIGHNRLI